MPAADRLTQLFDKITNLSFVVIGDYFLDRYFILDPGLSETSVETGLEARQVVSVRNSPGAAGTVVNNLHALGVGEIKAVGLVGDDGEGYEMIMKLREMGVVTNSLLHFSLMHTPTYMKPMQITPDAVRELERMDIKNRSPLTLEMEESIIATLRSHFSGENGVAPPNAVIISDQVEERNCGVITDKVREAISELAISHPGTIFFADSRRRIGEFRDVIIKPNRSEALTALEKAGRTQEYETDAKLAKSLSAWKSMPVFLTVGENGIWVGVNGDAIHADAIKYEGMIDICGAGDSAAAGIVSALACGFSPEEAAEMGNLCAGVTVRKLGTTGTASPQEILSLQM